MIFVTVGTQLPFRRLTDAAANWARATGEEAVIQTGDEESTDGVVSYRRQVPPDEFVALFKAARVVVAHAGIGTILTAQNAGKPLIVLPRRTELGEHRNDHQVATARQVEARPGLYVAWETSDLEGLLGRHDLVPAAPGTGEERRQLIARVADFLNA